MGVRCTTFRAVLADQGCRPAPFKQGPYCTMAAADVHAPAAVTTGAGVDAGAGASRVPGARCSEAIRLAHDTGATRQWRQGHAWALFNVDSEAGSVDADARFDGDAVFVHELATGRVVRCVLLHAVATPARRARDALL